MTYQFELLSKHQQRLLILLVLFRGYVNLSPTIITIFFRELKRFKCFRDLPVNDFDLLSKWAYDTGIWEPLPDFPETRMMRLNPQWEFWLRKQYRFWDEKEKIQIAKAYVRYYRWLGLNLYDMLSYTPPEEHHDNLIFISLEKHNLINALHLTIQLELWDFTFILLPLNAYLDASESYTEWIMVCHSIKDKLEQAPSKSKNFNYWYGLTHTYDTLGAAFLKKNDYQQSEYYYQKAIETYRASKQDTQYPEALRGLTQSLAAVTAYQQKWKESNKWYRQMHKVVEKFEDQGGLAAYHLNYGLSLLQQSKHQAAAEQLRQAVEQYTALDSTDSVGLAKLHLGSALIHLRRFAEAKNCLTDAMSVFTLLNDRFRQADVWDAFVMLYLRQKQFNHSADCARTALEFHISNKNVRNTGNAYQSLAIAVAGLGEFDETADYLRSALKLFHSIGADINIKEVFSVAKQIDKSFGTNLQKTILYT